jgi:parallel beta-helix repeat protein
MTYAYKISRRLALARNLILALVAACTSDLQENSDPSLPVAELGDLVVIPDSVVAEVGQSVRLLAYSEGRGYRERHSEESEPAVLVDWTATGGTITTDGLFSAGEVGNYRVVGKARGRKHHADTSIVVVVPPQPELLAILVSPDTAQLESQARRTFTAKAILSDSSRVDVGVTWRATGGIIDAGGVYVAGTAPGHFHAIATAVSSSKADTADITIDSAAVEPPTLEAVRLSPNTAALAADQSQQFAASGQMSDGSTASVTPAFTATGGTISPAGLYTAGPTPGTFRVIASAGGYADTSTVTIAGANCVGTGTRLCPGDDLQAKAAAAGSGATLVLQPGVYRMQSVNPLSRQTWQGESGAILSGAKVLKGWESDGAGRWFVSGQTQENTNYNRDYSCLSGHPGCFRPEQLWIDGVLYEHVTSLASVGSGKWHFDYGADRIYVPIDPAGKSIETSVTVYAFGGSATGVTIKGLIIEKYANAAQRAAVSGGSSWVIESNEVRHNHGTGIGIGANGVMRGNYVHHQGQLGVKAGGMNGLVENNEIAYNNTAYFGAGRYAETGGSKFAKTDGLIVRNNYVHHNKGPGLWTDINNINCLYEGNRVEDNEWRGIFHEISYACVIRNNVVRRNGFNSPGASSIEGAGILISDSPDVEVYGNTVEDNNAGIMAVEANRDANHPSEYGPHNVRNLSVHDNNVRQADDRRAAGVADWDSAADPYSAAANNRWARNTYVVGAGTKWQWAPNAVLTRAQWLASGQDSGSIYR